MVGEQQQGSFLTREEAGQKPSSQEVWDLAALGLVMPVLTEVVSCWLA